MQEIQSIGKVSWGRQDIRNALPEFVNLLAQKPIADNEGGMKAPHLFATWFLIKRLQPKVVIESGVWKGLGTWLIEQASPESQIICIDPVWDWIAYKSDKAHYLKEDFAQINWHTWNLPKDQTVLFFDDHQNAFQRILTAQKFGFQHLIFEDNYPASRGDCYSLKKAFMHAGFQAQKPKAFGRWEKWKHWLFHLKSRKSYLIGKMRTIWRNIVKYIMNFHLYLKAKKHAGAIGGQKQIIQRPCLF
jgi:hypothetical protein